MLLGGALIVGGWGLVERDRKSCLLFHSWCYSRKWERRVNPRYYFVVLVWIKIIRSQSKSKIPLCNPSGGKILLRASASYVKLLARVAFRTLPNIHDGAHSRKKPTDLRHWLFPQKSTTADLKLGFKSVCYWKDAANVDCKCMEFVGKR